MSLVFRVAFTVAEVALLRRFVRGALLAALGAGLLAVVGVDRGIQVVIVFVVVISVFASAYVEVTNCVVLSAIVIPIVHQYWPTIEG